MRRVPTIYPMDKKSIQGYIDEVMENVAAGNTWYDAPGFYLVTLGESVHDAVHDTVQNEDNIKRQHRRFRRFLEDYLKLRDDRLYILNLEEYLLSTKLRPEDWHELYRYIADHPLFPENNRTEVLLRMEGVWPYFKGHDPPENPYRRETFEPLSFPKEPSVL